MKKYNNKKYHIDDRFVNKIYKERNNLIKDSYLLTICKNNPNKTPKEHMRMFWIYKMHHDSLYCEICGNKITNVKHKLYRLTYDHILPQSMGGKTDYLNASPTHSICNSLKANHLPEEWEKIGLKILSEYGIKVHILNSIYNYTK